MINAIAFYRVARMLFQWRLPFLPSFFKLLIHLVYNSSIPYQAQIGHGTMLAYGGIGVVIHKKAIIKKNVTIGANVTIGGRSGFQELPVIDDNVYIGAGAKILGPVHIGKNVIIGANAVVISDIPPHCVAVGVPARVRRQ